MNQRNELRQRLRQRAGQKKTQSAKSPEHTLVLVQIALTLLPLVTACIYLFGMSWHMGYLHPFGVDASEFPLSTEQNLLFGISSLFINALKVITYPIFAIAIMMLLTLVMLMTGGLIQQYKNALMARLAQYFNGEVPRAALLKLLKYAASPSQAEWLDRVFSSLAKLYLRFCLLMFVCGVVIFVAYRSYTGGEDSAQKEMEKMRQHPSEIAIRLIDSVHPKGIQALRIVCNSVQCTFWTPQEGTIYLRHDQIDSVTVPPKPDSKEKSPGEKAS